MNHFEMHQNKKYRCAIGNTAAGSHVNNSPSARTSYVSGSTSSFGVAELCAMFAFPILRQFSTGQSVFTRRRCCDKCSSIAALETNVSDVSCVAPPNDPNMGRY